MKNYRSSRSSQTEVVALDRRNQERQEAAGDVTLILDHELEVSATLRDQSDSGFRAAHHYILLESGQEVQYRIGTREGKARVVWCRIGSGGCESGFYIL